MRVSPLSFTLPFLAVLAAVPVVAQQADTSRHVKFTGSVGLVNTSGNSDVTTLDVGDQLFYPMGNWDVTQLFSVVYGRNEGVTNTSIWTASLRGTRQLNSRLGIYGLVGWDRNTFAGIDRRWEEGVGLAAHLLVRPRDTIDGEAGLSFIQQLSTEGAHRDFPSARVASTYKHLFSKTAYFQQGVEILPDLKTSQNLRINTETALVAPISAHIGLKISYVVRFDNQPEPGFKKTDRLLTSGVQVTY